MRALRHIRSNLVGYVALFLAVGGGTAFAVSGGAGRKAGTLDGLSAARFERHDTASVPTTTVLTVGGLKVKYSCVPAAKRGKRGSSPDVELGARSLVDNARITMSFTTGSSPAGSAFFAQDADVDAADPAFDLDQGRSFGEGSAVYSVPDGSVVQLDFGFTESGTACVAHGVALGG